jgi:hypothetical protein
MNNILKTIRKGFLQQIGAQLWLWLSGALLALGGWGIRLSLPNTQVSSIERTGYLVATVVFVVAWLIYHRRVQLEVSYLRSGLLIHSARYGAGDITKDVAPYIKRKIATGHRKIPVGNSLLDGGDDPCRNAKKTGVVEYSRPGKRETQTVIEDGGHFDFT